MAGADTPAAALDATQAERRTVRTANGEVSILRLSDGSFAIRNQPDPALIDRVRALCKPHGRWHPRYRNWIVPESALPAILDGLS